MISKNEIERINKSIDNTDDFNRVKKIGDRCSFMGCNGKVQFLCYDTMHGKNFIVLKCSKCGTENWKKLKER